MIHINMHKIKDTSILVKKVHALNHWMEVVLRSVLILLGLFFITKLLGKKQLSKLSFFEYIVGITIGDIAGTISMDVDLQASHGVVAILVWASFLIFVSNVSLKSISFRKAVEGTTTTLIKEGKILEENVKKEKYTVDELMEQLRKKDIFYVEDVAFAMLETNGELSVLLKKEKQNVTREDLLIKGEATRLPQTIIMDGNIMKEAVHELGYSVAWVKEQLKKKGAAADKVFLGQADSAGHLYLDYYED
ncbi:hypothetical protein ASE51_14195 [Bacillus sp. Root147]|nr:hypothetical protein ASE51_14195 [Bacillus sp. Root147]